MSRFHFSLPRINHYIFTHESDSRLLNLALYFTRIIITSVRKFMKENAFMHASSVSFATVISLIPVLTVGLALLTITTGLNEKKELLFLKINKILMRNNISLNLDPYFEALSDIINSATQIGAVGFIFLIFSATGILRSLESAFNSIWKVTDERSLFQKFIYYFFILSVGPLLLFSAFSGVSKISEYIRKPHLETVLVFRDKFWAGGDKGTVVAMDNDGKKVFQLEDGILDRENTVCKAEDFTDLAVCYPEILSDYRFKFASVDESTIYFASDNGLIAYSSEPERRWNLILFKGIEISYFYHNGNNIFMILDDNRLLRYDLVTRATEVISTAEIKLVPLALIFTGKEYILTGEKGHIAFYDPAFKFITKTRIANSNLRDIHISNGGIYISGERGLILNSEDLGKTWKTIKHKNFNYSHILNSPVNREMIITTNELGNILYSNNSGQTWSTAALGDTKINDIAVNQSGFMAVGDFNQIVTAVFDNNLVAGFLQPGGKHSVSFFSIYNFIIFLFFIWLFFTFIYMFLPGTNVPFQAAAVSGLLTSMLFYLFIISFNLYVQSFTGTTQIIYKTLAAFPIFLLSIYGASVVVIFGAVITSVIQYQEYITDPDILHRKNSHNQFAGAIALFYYLYHYQKNNHNYPELLKAAKSSELAGVNINRVIKHLSANNLLTVDKSDRLVPLRTIDEISIDELKLMVPDEEFTYNRDFVSDEGSARIGLLVKDVSASLSGITLADILKLH